MKNSARLLGLLKNDIFVLDSDIDTDCLADFMLADYRDRNGKNILQLYLEKHQNDLSAAEQTLLAERIAAYSSLFDIKAADSKNSTVLLADVFNEGNEVEIVDIGLSTSLIPERFLLFSRIVKGEGFYATSGVSFVFDKQDEALLKEKYRKMIKNVVVKDEQAKKFIVFFKLNRKFGLEIRFR
ncbi:MAG: hypothetical protein ACU837_15815 [Gammaproteobacteria bacterium]